MTEQSFADRLNAAFAQANNDWQISTIEYLIERADPEARVVEEQEGDVFEAKITRGPSHATDGCWEEDSLTRKNVTYIVESGAGEQAKVTAVHATHIAGWPIFKSRAASLQP